MRRRFSGRRAPVVDDAEHGELRHAALLAVLDRACELQSRAETVLRACAGPGETDTAVAREGGYVAGEFHRLQGWVLDAGDPTDVEREVAQLLVYHCQVVHYAVRLAFPRSGWQHPDGRSGTTATLGDPAGRLRAVRDDLPRGKQGHDR